MWIRKGVRAFADWWEDATCSEWTENKLLSRKWLVVVVVVLWGLVSDACGRPLADSTVNLIQWVVPPWVTIQGFVDMYRYRASENRYGSPKKRRKRKEREVEDGNQVL